MCGEETRIGKPEPGPGKVKRTSVGREEGATDYIPVVFLQG